MAAHSIPQIGPDEQLVTLKALSELKTLKRRKGADLAVVTAIGQMIAGCLFLSETLGQDRTNKVVAELLYAQIAGTPTA